jgi:hypothetical protein
LFQTLNPKTNNKVYSNRISESRPYYLHIKLFSVSLLEFLLTFCPSHQIWNFVSVPEVIVLHHSWLKVTVQSLNHRVSMSTYWIFYLVKYITSKGISMCNILFSHILQSIKSFQAYVIHQFQHNWNVMKGCHLNEKNVTQLLPINFNILREFSIMLSNN